MKTLHLNLKGEYFDEIKSGEKKYEYREYNDYWHNRLVNKEFDKIILMKGYPKKDDTERRIERPWKGYKIEEITHKHFNNKLTRVFSIMVN